VEGAWQNTYNRMSLGADKLPESKFLVTKIGFGGSVGMRLSLVVVTDSLELLVTFGMSLEGVCHELFT
jgi:hypothetical protein